MIAFKLADAKLEAFLLKFFKHADTSKVFISTKKQTTFS